LFVGFFFNLYFFDFETKFIKNEVDGEKMFNDLAKKKYNNSNEYHKIISQNAINLIQEVRNNKKSPFSKILLNKLTAGIPNKKAHEIFNIPKSTISNSQNLKECDNIFKSIKYKPNVIRKKISQNHIAHIFDIWNECSRESATRTICSDRKNKKYILIYKKYLESKLPNNIKKYVAIGSFLSLKPKNVKVLSKKEALCIHCKIGYQLIEKLKIINQQIHKFCVNCEKIIVLI